MTPAEQGRLRLARSLLVEGRVTVVGVFAKGVDSDVVDGAVLRCKRRASGWSCPCESPRVDGECAHVLAVQMVVGEWLPAEQDPPLVRGADVVSGWDEWGWVVRVLLAAARAYDKTYAGDVRAFEAVQQVLDQLDDEAVRGVAAHLAMAPIRMGDVVLRAEALELLTLLHSWGEDPSATDPAGSDPP